MIELIVASISSSISDFDFGRLFNRRHQSYFLQYTEILWLPEEELGQCIQLPLLWTRSDGLP